MSSLQKIIIATTTALIIPLLFWANYRIETKKIQGGFKRKQIGIEISTKKIVTTPFEIYKFVGDDENNTIMMMNTKDSLFKYSFTTEKYTLIPTYNEEKMPYIPLPIQSSDPDEKEINYDSIHKANFLKEIYKNEKVYSQTLQKDKLIRRTLAEDGMVCIDFGDNQPAIYLNYYTNKFYLFQQPSNLIYKANTIDTLASLPEITFIPNKRIYTYGKTTRMVNRYGQACNGYLFVNSLIKADNDQELMKKIK